MTYDEYVDKYMYRIIGITEYGEMYLIKETFLKAENKTSFMWNSKYTLPDCLGNTCEWPKVDLYNRLNGETSNGNPIFVDNSYYEYMTKDGDWYNLIADHNWMYGDTNETKYNGDYMYEIETGKIVTKKIWPNEATQTACSSSSQCTEKDYTWSKSTKAKIGLMYMHDVLYAYTGGNPGSYTNVANSWIHFQKDGYNTSQDYDWLLTRFGAFGFSSSNVDARNMNNNGNLENSYNLLCISHGTRPVFYLSSNVKIKEGTDGTKDNPYILDVQDLQA